MCCLEHRITTGKRLEPRAGGGPSPQPPRRLEVPAGGGEKDGTRCNQLILDWSPAPRHRAEPGHWSPDALSHWMEARNGIPQLLHRLSRWFPFRA